MLDIRRYFVTMNTKMNHQDPKQQYVNKPTAYNQQPNQTAAHNGWGQANGQNADQPDYSFILNADQAVERKAISTPIKILVVLGLVFLLFGAVALALSLKGSGKESGDSLLGLAQQQQEIIRLSGDAETKANEESTKAFATTTNLSVTSDQQKLIAQMEKSGTKADAKTLDLQNDAGATSQLSTAENSTRYDKVFSEVLRKKLATYQSELKTVYDQTKNQETRQILADSYKNSSELLKSVQ